MLRAHTVRRRVLGVNVRICCSGVRAVVVALGCNRRTSGSLLLRPQSRSALSASCCMCLLCCCVRVCVVQLFSFLLFERVALLLLLLVTILMLSLLRLHGSGTAAVGRPLLVLLVIIVGIGSR
jgi:hypothetical protein